jgi:hypothetical protein
MRLPAILLALAMLLAGCLGGGNGEGDEDLGLGAVDGDGNVVPPTGRPPIKFDNEDNVTFEPGAGGVDHHHDYWEGRTRVVVFEQPAKMHPFAATRKAAEYEAQATFRPAQPALIYEGTETVEFTITTPGRHACEGEDTVNGDYVCTSNFFGVEPVADPAPPAGLKLRYKHASTREWIDVGAIAWDVPLPIKIMQAIETDMPHATASLWEFQVLSPNKHDSSLAFVAKAELVRGPVGIPLWPGHPDFYANNLTSRVVLDTVATSGDPGAFGHGAAIVPAEAGVVYADKLISYGTRTLYVWINITEVQAPNPATAPSSWFLWHTNSSGNHNITNPADTETHGFDVREHHWVLPVDDSGMDSPYSDGSRWWFMLGGNLDFVLLSAYGDYANWAATYNIKVIASSVPLAEADYHWHCLRPEAVCPAAE